MTSITPAPKPRPRSSEKAQSKVYSSISRPSFAEAKAAAQKLREGNAGRRAKRAAKFKARLSRADWKKLRLEVFARDGFRCVNREPAMPGGMAYPSIYQLRHDGGGKYSTRCWNEDATKTGKGLVCDHKTYARFGHELLSDLRTLCRSCNARLTKELRANHAGGFRKSQSQKLFGERAE